MMKWQHYHQKQESEMYTKIVASSSYIPNQSSFEHVDHKIILGKIDAHSCFLAVLSSGPWNSAHTTIHICNFVSTNTIVERRGTLTGATTAGEPP
jgi:hypothetical protein